jgi:hypothetical protein
LFSAVCHCVTCVYICLIAIACICFVQIKNSFIHSFNVTTDPEWHFSYQNVTKCIVVSDYMVIFWNIAPKHWIYMDTVYCNSFYFYLWLSNYWEYVIECVFAVEGNIILKTWLILRIKKFHHAAVCLLQI